MCSICSYAQWIILTLEHLLVYESAELVYVLSLPPMLILTVEHLAYESVELVYGVSLPPMLILTVEHLAYESAELVYGVSLPPMLILTVEHLVYESAELVYGCCPPQLTDGSHFPSVHTEVLSQHSPLHCNRDTFLKGTV